jgi:ABC-type thiamin/hydroxymethylpyrimidine transport system permease subunit
VLNAFQFGDQVITTKVNMLVPKRTTIAVLDVVAALAEPAIGNQLEADLLLSAIAKP